MASDVPVIKVREIPPVPAETRYQIELSNWDLVVIRAALRSYKGFGPRGAASRDAFLKATDL